MDKKQAERTQKQIELANLFFEMGMPLEVIEEVAGVDTPTLFKANLNKQIIDKRRQNPYNDKSK